MSIRTQILLLFLFFPLAEFYMFFAKGVYIHPYLFDSSIKESVRWYVNDIVQGINWIVIFGVFYYREKYASDKDSIFMTQALQLLVLFKIVDFIAYLCNHRHAGWIYSLIYIIILLYAYTRNIRSKQFFS